jgi:hypothetical protein
MTRFGLAVLACVMASSAALAQEASSNIGMLTCTAVEGGEKPDTAAPSDAASLQCSFKPIKSGPEEMYSGTIQRVGEEPISGKVVLMWAVSAPPNTELAPGLLEQTYVSGKPFAPSPGGTASSVLYGQKNKSIMLQQVRNPGTEAMTPAVTIVDLNLKLARA